MKETRVGGFDCPVLPVATPAVAAARIRVPGVSTSPPPVRTDQVSEGDLPDADSIDVHEIRRAVLTRQGWLVPI